MADTRRLGRHRNTPHERLRTPVRRRRTRLAITITGAGLVIVIVAAFAVYNVWHPAQPEHPRPQRPGLAVTPGAYLGLYSHSAPSSYAGVDAFTTATGVSPRVIVYYSGWLEAFQTGFATTVADHGAIPLVQMNPTHASVAAVTAGRYDSYLTAYAKAVRAYHHPVILSFGHEMNGSWYSWGYTHTSPAAFVAAWRHIVTLFRRLGTNNVTWLWTINTIHKNNGVPSPGPWWPGNSYVNWIGIDGYFTSQSSVFSSVFGPTIVYVHSLTRDPILITETSATPAATQPAKIADLFAGVRLYDLLGFIWFDSIDKVDWRITSPAAIAAFRRGAESYLRTPS